MATKEQRKAAPSSKAPHTPLAEWIAAGLSTLIVLGVIGFLIYDGVWSPPTPPDITVEIDSIGPAGPGYLVQFRARNRGRLTAAAVVVEGELVADTGKVETAETTLDYSRPRDTRNRSDAAHQAMGYWLLAIGLLHSGVSSACSASSSE